MRQTIERIATAALGLLVFAEVAILGGIIGWWVLYFVS